MTKKFAYDAAMQTETPLQKAVRLCGGQTELARRIGRSQQNVAYWLTDAVKGVPAECAAAIEDASNGAVTRHDLRPDIFAPASNEAA